MMAGSKPGSTLRQNPNLLRLMAHQKSASGNSGLALSKGKSMAVEKDFEKRIARIKGKMAKGKGAAGR